MCKKSIYSISFVLVLSLAGRGWTQASNPYPDDGAVYADTWVSLSWSPGPHAVSYDVYFGENLDDVKLGTGGTFRGNLTGTTFVVGFPGFPYPGGLVPGKTYYWRIDEVNLLHADSPWRGNVWRFRVPSWTAYGPEPADGAASVDADVTLGWQPGFDAKLHTVYFGDNFADVESGTGSTRKGSVAAASYTPGPLESDKTYYWRVDEFDGSTSHKGDVWSFTTAGLPGLVALSGILRFNGQPMSSITGVSPSFLCRNEITGQYITGITTAYNNNTGAYSISGLPSVRVGISVVFHTRGVRASIPGNYEVFKIVDISSLSNYQRANFGIGLEQRIHMTSPWDNDAVNPLTYDPLNHPAARYPEYNPGIDFVWDAVPGATRYQIYIAVYRDPYDHPEGYGFVQSVINSSVQGTSFSADLEPSRDLEHYQAHIYAYDPLGNRLGNFQITYEHGNGGDYRFKVVAASDADAAEIALAYDDGTGETYAIISEGQYLRQRFLVSDFGFTGDQLVDTVQINWASGISFEEFAGEIKLRDYDTGTVVSVGSLVRPLSGWRDYDVSGLRFISDHFYVELWQIDGFNYIWSDTHEPHRQMSEVSTNAGVDWHLFDYPVAGSYEIDFMVRVLLAPATAAGRTIYVDGDANGANDGSSWTDACRCLQDALASAQSGDEIRVARGTYKPDQRAVATARQIQIAGSGDRAETFQLLNDVSLRGGYAGFAETDPDVRDIHAYRTILSGDLSDDDGPHFTNNSENSYHVVTGSGTGVTAVLDGFTISGGNANRGISADDTGGGMLSENGSPMIVNCSFTGNWAVWGAGMSNIDTSSPTVINCTFTNNSAERGGGGIYCSESSPTVANTIVWDDSPDEIYLVAGSIEVTSSDVQGAGRNPWPGRGNINSDPLFADVDGADDQVGTEDDDLRLSLGSPCIDAGDNAAILPTVVGDLDANARIMNGFVDMGAYEGAVAAPPPALFEALDTNLSFTTGGSADWFGQTTTSCYDGDAAQSGDISHNQQSWMQTTVTGAGTVSFHWKVSSEADYDFLEFYIDGSLQDRISGSVDWQQKTYTIADQGPHTLRWRYVKDKGTDSGSDCGWVDKAEWAPHAPPGHEEVVVNIDRDFEYVPRGGPLGSVAQTAAVGLNSRPYETLERVPEYGQGRVLYGYIPLGNGNDRKISFAVDTSNSNGWVLYLDTNNNEDLTDDGQPRSNQGTGVKFAALISLHVEVISDSGETIVRPYQSWFWITESQSPLFYALCHYRGQISIGREQYTAIVQEYRNHDALYKESGLWIDLNRDGKFEIDKSEEHFQDGQAITIEDSKYVLRLDYP